MKMPTFTDLLSNISSSKIFEFSIKYFLIWFAFFLGELSRLILSVTIEKQRRLLGAAMKIQLYFLFFMSVCLFFSVHGACTKIYFTLIWDHL